MNPNDLSCATPMAAIGMLPGTTCTTGTVEDLPDEGLVAVRTASAGLVRCELLEQVLDRPLAVGDRVLVALTMAPESTAVIVGRIARYRRGPAAPVVDVTAANSLTLRCGEASLELRADGKVLLKGDDVVVRAKGTKRIRAGHVAIN